MIRAIEDGLVMQQLLYAGEVRSIKDIEIPATEVKDNELKLAKQLIEAQSVETFDPSQYTDAVAERIEAAVQKKIEGQEIATSEAPQQGAQVIDLMEALRASLERKGAKPAKAAPAPAKSAEAVSPKTTEPEVRKPPKRAAAAATPAAAPKKVRSKA
jgi:DNA end-binding protein Ku